MDPPPPPPRCSGPWIGIRPLIMNETHAAIQEWAEKNGHKLLEYDPGTVVIQVGGERDWTFGSRKLVPGRDVVRLKDSAAVHSRVQEG